MVKHNQEKNSLLIRARHVPEWFFRFSWREWMRVELRLGGVGNHFGIKAVRLSSQILMQLKLIKGKRFNFILKFQKFCLLKFNDK